MNLLLLEPGELADDGRAEIDGRRALHVRAILGKTAGDRIKIGVIGGRVGMAELREDHGDRIVLACVLDRDPPPPSAVTLVLALPRPPVLRRVLQHVATAGVKTIALVASARVEKSYWSSPALAEAELRAQLVLGLEQAGDTILPKISLHRRFRPFVEDELARWPIARRLFADVGAPPCPCDVAGPTVVLVGPEGGWVPFEVELLAATGCVAVGLGSRPLRVEAAVSAVLGRLGSP